MVMPRLPMLLSHPSLALKVSAYHTKLEYKIIYAGLFQFPMTYVSKNGTGTGEVGISIQTVDGIPVEDFQLNVAQNPGTYSVQWNLKAEPDPNCDPSQGPCEKWLPGVYKVNIGEYVCYCINISLYCF